MFVELLAAWPYFFVWLALCVACVLIDDWLDRGDARSWGEDRDET